MAICTSCGLDNPSGAKFCAACGAAQTLTCVACGSAYRAGDRFCVECGAAVDASSPTQPAGEARAEAPVAERRLVSVVFADLVGFTSISESRDPEEVRELLSRYFDSCRRLVELYGGAVEKFIGDAVMAVWGTPVATEDDAERAVRAALDLVAMVSALGQEIGAPGLRARAGVFTGEAAVTLGAVGEGMVAGDLVNTASRVQGVADPGSVLVGEATKRATEAAIAYADAGRHELKGKAEPVPLFRAIRVTGGRAGALKGGGLEPPFVGRDRELRLIKELFHASAEEKNAHLVSVIGIAGIGKSRIAWEFFKYIDGLADVIWWRRGRCLAYGEGVAYWALAEMVRMQAGIVEGESTDSARAKLRAAVGELVTDESERMWLEPRLAQLVGLEQAAASERDDLFAAWRLLFERMADQGPAVLVFEDMQWADASLLEFIEYLLEWSRKHPLYVLVLSRPELAVRHSGFGATGRNVTTLSLEPLSAGAVEELLAGLVPGLPDALRSQILARAEGVPLYAVETVRMLLDRGLLARDGDEYHPTDQIASLAVPETLHALVAARLDGLAPVERRLIQDASVLGKIFTKQTLSSLSGLPEAELEPILQTLVRKEVLVVQSDPRSPERGQYGFLQDLLKQVAYETMAKDERKSRHVAAAHALENAFGPTDPEIVEVLASHYLAAYDAAPNAPGAHEIRTRASEMLTRAGERAVSLAARDEAGRYYDQAAQLTDEPVPKAQLLEHAGVAAWAGGHGTLARARFEQAIALYTSAGETHPAARVAALQAEITWAEGRIDRAVEDMEASYSVLFEDEPDGDLAMLAAQLGRLLYFLGEPARATERIEQALVMAESLDLPDVLSEALDTKGTILSQAWQRPREGRALLEHALAVAVDAGIPQSAFRAYFNLSCLTYYSDEYEAALRYAQEGLAYARRVGDRNWEASLLSTTVGTLALRGEWQEALSLAEELPDPGELEPTEEMTAIRFAAVELLAAIPPLYVAKGRVDDAEQFLSRFVDFRDSADVQERTAYSAAASVVLRAQSRLEEAVAAGVVAFEEGRTKLGSMFFGSKLGLVSAAEAALELGDLERVESLLSIVDAFGKGEITPFARAQADRFHALLAVSRGKTELAETSFTSAIGMMEEIGLAFWLAVTKVEYAEWLIACGRPGEAEPLLGEAHTTFEELDAQPWLERLDGSGGRRLPVAPSVVTSSLSS
jgi:class 3 adenylate cyclase/tetratricopeptide (TPR) repeat protein